MLCANLADPAPVSATHGRGPAAAGAAGMSAGHGPPLAAHGHGPTAGMSAGRGPPPTAHGGSTAPDVVLGMSTGHGPQRVAHGRGPVATAVLGLSAGHGPLCVARGRGPAVVAGLRWTCGPDSSDSGQRQTVVPGGNVHSSRSASS